ncbi:sensor histidine kinase [Peptoniphilus obesi]|uniref:sensor histidine kinase n=1 Tax=Peptoniphilus obesi TaxID=1472765 RepID=UPI0004BC2CF5|nr:ATP-binding protein [Peptoniphilus obesi]
MNKRIYRSLIFIAFLTLILSTIVSLFVNYKFYEKSSIDNMSNLTNIIKEDLENTDDRIEYLERASRINSKIRISYFDQGANPIFDSKADVKTMENHGNRKEIINANSSIEKKATRYSETLSTDSVYIAYRLSDGSYIRLASPINTIAGSFFKILPINLILAVFIFIIAMFISKNSTKKILEPLNKSSSDPESVDLSEIPEISPFVREITAQKDIIAKHLEQIKIERDTIGLILENMREGLLILDSEKNILVINKKATEFLSSNLNSSMGLNDKNILYVTREEKLIDSIENSYKGKSYSDSIEVGDKIIKYYVNPVYIGDEISGSIVLLIDETKRQRLEKIREEFSANVSHELKTPLTSICGFAELLKNDMVAVDDQKEIINSIYSESNRLLDLIDEIIRISSLESSVTVKKEDVNLREIADELAYQFRDKAEKKNVRIIVNGNEKLMANNTMMWELLSNLLDNAIKYNKEDGSVKIDMSRDNDNVILSVEDTGIGIDNKDLDRVFERFYRVDKSRSKKSGGTGLGLSIVKHIIKNHDGNLKVESELGKGTKITVYLPID